MRSPQVLSAHRTFRWNDGVNVDRYEAVETTDAGLRWYRWSHQPGEGRLDEVEQDYESFLRDGPPRPVPERVIAALRAWLEARR